MHVFDPKLQPGGKAGSMGTESVKVNIVDTTKGMALLGFMAPSYKPTSKTGSGKPIPQLGEVQSM